ncbi:hypothetical protein EXIGLDRAFT_745760 [Exidia glandulosa HHB12029]|uniref:Amidohydrolase-related domain-containing protein n=1 Tax=Exidia glandulosa HHB12029 TaxID=1314781 RepID=A0A165N6T5_EXIGL|nr:hypothetical protein EXIGLDRAFT_745760 [Exidia glandulosa HHB12029]
MTTVANTHSPLYSPSVGARRKNVKLPKLPLSAFTPPNSGTGDKFPLLPSPSAIHPSAILDAGVSGSVEDWKTQMGASLVAKSRGVILALPSADAELVKAAQEDPSVIAASVPFDLSAGEPDPASVPAFIASPPANFAIALRTTFTAFTPQLADGVHWAISRGLTVDIDVQADLGTEAGWESLNELLSNATSSERPQGSSSKKGAIVLSNVLPAPLDLELPLVKLLTHPQYRNFQNYTSTISLIPNVHLKFAPPKWNAPIPSASTSTTSDNGGESAVPDSGKKEWKRRIKMYLGQGVEAFGWQRIVYASAGAEGSNVGDWYALARESLAELGVEQEAVDGVFGLNAQGVYSV